MQNKHDSVLHQITLTNNNTHKSISILPPKPEERWSYIKELEKKSTDLQNLNHLSKSSIDHTTQLNNEQYQILKQIDADRRK